nr:ABC transporter permease [Rhodococcus qingshengii]
MRMTLYKRQFTGGRAVIKVIAALFGVLGVALLCLRASGKNGVSPDLVSGTTSLALSAIGVMWILMPIMSGLSDDNLHPRHFQLLPLEPVRLARALFSTSLVGMTVPITALAAAAIPIYAATHHPAALPLAIIAWPATVLLIVGTSRVAMLAMSQLLRSRRSRELGLLAFGTFFGGLYLLQFPLQSRLGTVVDGDVTWPLTVAHSIPFAWGITSVDAAAGGAWLLAAGAVLALVLVDLALLWSWQRLVVRYFNGKVAESAGATSVQLKNQGRDIRTGWRASRLGTVISREISLWHGDMRRRTQLLSVAIMTLVSGFGPLISSSIPFSAAWGAWFLIYLAMAAGSNLYGFDGASIWHLVMIPEAAAADVRGRQIAWVIVMTPFVVVATAAVRIFGDLGTDRLAVPIAVGISMMGVGAGLVVAISAKAPYPVPEMKKTFSFNTRGSFNGSSFGLIILAIVIFAATTAPGVLLGALLPNPVNYFAIPVAVAIGALGAWIGGRVAITRMQREPDRILFAVTTT